MKKLLLVFSLLFSFTGFSQSITEVLYPKYVQGVGSGSPSNDARVPYSCRMTLNGLTPNATYRFFCAFIQNPASAANGAAGAMTLANQTGNFTRITSPSVNVPGEYGEFTTNGAGSYTGWFIIEPSSDIIFTPGNQLYFRINLNNGAGGAIVATQLTATNSITVINWGFTSGAPLEGSAIYNVTNSSWINKNFVMLYDNIAGTGRPVTGSFVENDGVNETTAEFYDLFYEFFVNGNSGIWGTIIPNNLSNGINNISQYALSDGSFINKCTSPNGVYGTTDTRNASEGNDVFDGDGDPLLIIDCTPTAGCNISTSATVTNVACFGATTGAVDLTVANAASPVTYSWSNGAVTQDLTNVPAGTYTVNITDANNCTATASATVTQPASPLSATAVAAHATCGASNGSVNLTVTGGTSPFTYLWSNGATTEDINGLAAGSYSVIVTDANGCTTTASATVNNIAGPGVTTTNIIHVLCFGQSTGSIDITVTGGTAPYSFLWSNGATTEDISGLAAGIYAVTVTDANNCVATTSATITQPAAALSATAVAINASCGASNGSIDLTVTGGTIPYTYLWSNGATTEDINGIGAGTYSVTVTDANGCITTSSATVNSTGGPGIAVTNITHVLCFGQTTGVINITVTGGAPPYTYLWSNGATSEDISSLAAGTYNVAVTDANNCTATASVTVTQPASALNANAAVIHATCGTSNGSVNLTVTGGTNPYTYLWSNGATTEDISNLAAGSYSVTITDANACTTTASATVNNIAGPGVTVTNIVHVLCFGQISGTINITATGGTAPYSFLWSNGATTEDISGLAAGTYSVTVSDANNCIATTSATITQPAAVLNATVVATNASCGASNGSVDLTVTGGTIPYTYSWSNGATTEDISGLAAGTYSVTVTDANGCTTTTNASVSNTGGPGITVTSVTHVLCFGQSTGTIDITVTGGVPPYTYLWSNGAASEDISGLPAGTYNVAVTDANNCTATISVAVTQPASALSAIAVATNASCGASNGSIDLTLTGGTSPYTFLWSNGATTEDISGLAAATYTVSITDANGCTASSSATVNNNAGPGITVSTIIHVFCFGQSTGSIDITVTAGTAPYTYLWSNGATTEDINGLVAGTYNVTVTDANNCTATVSAIVTQPVSALNTSTGVANATCGLSNGSIDLTVTGGTIPYTYLWSNGAITEDISGLAAGIYTVTVTDVNGCSTTASATVNDIAGPVVAVTNITHVLCFGQSMGAIDITITGGTVPYTYLWSNGAITEDISALPAGTYSVIVTDANNCTSTVSATINEPTLLTVTETHTAITCFGGNSAVTIAASGGTPPYNGTGVFNLPAGTHSFPVMDANGCTSSIIVTIVQPTQLLASETHTAILCNGTTSTVTISATGGIPPYMGVGIFNSPAGTFNFTVTDANGCTSSIAVTIPQPSSVVAASSAGTIGCNGGTTNVTVTATGGTAPYTGTGTFTRSAGTYSFFVTDANGCIAVTTLTIAEPPALVAAASTAIIACNGGITNIVVTAAGGTSPYTGTGTFPRGPGTWSFTVTDANGCSSTTSVTITEPPLLTASASADMISECGATTRVTVIASGGTAPYTYPGAGDYIRGPGVWSFTVSDAAGCTTTTEITIPAPDCLKIYPNPANSFLTVNHSRAKAGTIIKLFSSNGSLGLIKQVQEGSITTTLDLRKLAAASYVLVFYHDGGREEIQFIKSN